MKKFVIAGAMLLMMGLAVPSFAARQDQEQKKEEPHPAPPAHQEHQQPAHQEHPPQAAHPAPPAQHQRAPQPARPAHQAAPQPSHQHQAPPQAQPQHQAPAKAQHQQHHAPQQHPAAHPPQAGTHPAPGKPAPQPTHNGTHHGGTHNPAAANNYHGARPSAQQARTEFAHSHANNWQSQHRTWVQRGGYHGYRIPDDRFRVYFGRPHPFRVWGLPLRFVSGYPSFQYDGYWVTLVDPWPEFWPSDWYQTDDVYLDYTDDGYYLYDVTRGGPGIACEVAD